MAESQPPKEAAESSAPPAVSTATTTAEVEPPSQLQPPQHWTNLPVPEDDADSSLGEDALSSTASNLFKHSTLPHAQWRTYHHDMVENQYWGPNDERQNSMLDIGHHSCTLLMGGKIYLAPLPDKIEKALDIGTGTGIWAMDFGDERPETQVIGTDISPIQPTWVPPNVSFQIEDFANEWTFQENTFDYIHTRWLVGSIPDWTVFFKRAYKALKPGGYIKSMDFDGQIRSDDGTVTKETAVYQWGYIFQEGARKMGSRASFNPITEGLQRKGLEEAGFSNITEKFYKVPLCEWHEDPVLHEVGQFSRIPADGDVEGFIGMMATQLGWTKEEISIYGAHLRRELKSLQVHAYFRGCVAYAQKPFDD